MTAHITVACLIIGVTAIVTTRNLLPKPTPIQERQGTGSPSPLFLNPTGATPKRGETALLHMVKSEVGQTMIDFADPHAPVRPVEVLRQITYPSNGGEVELHWLQWASQLAPHDVEIKRAEFYWTLQIKGPDAAAQCLLDSINQLEDDGLLWLDLANAVLYLPAFPNRGQIVLTAYARRNGWKGWGIEDIAKLAARLGQEKKVLQQKKKLTMSDRAILENIEAAIVTTRAKLKAKHYENLHPQN